MTPFSIPELFHPKAQNIKLSPGYYGSATFFLSCKFCLHNTCKRIEVLEAMMENRQLLCLHISCRIWSVCEIWNLSKIEARSSSRHGGGVMVQPWCHGGVACWWMVSWYRTSPYGGTWRSVRCGPRMRISCPSRRRPWRRVRFLHCFQMVTSCNSNTNLQDKNLQWIKMIKFYKYNCCIVETSWET